MTEPVQRRIASAAPTTLHTTFEEDLANYAAAGLAGIGLWEVKMTDGADAERLARFADSGLTATFCFPQAPGIVAGNGSWFAEPKDPAVRLEMLLASIKRFAAFRPEAVICLAGAPHGDLDQQRRDVVAALREAATVADGEGVTLALEIISPGSAGSLAPTVEAGMQLLSDIGSQTMKLLVDAWHTNGPDGEAQVEKHAERVVGVQLCDRKPGFRGWYDRAMPGTGELQVAGLVASAERGGFTGFYEVEVFSDDGTFGADYPDSFWKLRPLDVLKLARDTSLAVLAAAGVR